MAETTQETVITTQDKPAKQTVVTPVKVAATTTQSLEYLVYFLFGVLEILLVFRLVLRLMGASLASGFVSMIYGITRFFIMPFEGIFSRAYTEGLETTSVLEPSTIVAIIVYALLAWGIVKLVHVLSGEKLAE